MARAAGQSWIQGFGGTRRPYARASQMSGIEYVGVCNSVCSGKNNIYSGEARGELLEIARKAGAELPEHARDLTSLRHILRKRKDKARAYFDELAGKFGRHYVPGRSWKGLAEGLLKILNYDVVADLGAGEGTLSQLLAQRAKHVIAVDHSRKMVAFGKKLAKEHGLKNLEYRQGSDVRVPWQTTFSPLRFEPDGLGYVGSLADNSGANGSDGYAVQDFFQQHVRQTVDPDNASSRYASPMLDGRIVFNQ